MPGFYGLLPGIKEVEKDEWAQRRTSDLPTKVPRLQRNRFGLCFSDQQFADEAEGPPVLG